jgi:hypothetical protein
MDDDRRFRLDVWANVYVTSNGKRVAEFERQACTYHLRNETLTCEGGGRSPLAGTRYVGKKANKNSIIRYYCTEGCKANSRAPAVMTKD